MQEFLVASIVTACTVYAAWVLMPAALRRTFARRVQHWPWPPLLAKRVRRAAVASTGCGCDGCDARPPASAAPAPGSHPIRIHRRPPA